MRSVDKLRLVRSGLALAAAALGASAAQADDWESVCTFNAANLSLIVRYDAGGPSYELQVTTSGESELGRGRIIPMNVLQTPDDTVLMSKWDQELQVLLRLSKSAAATATIEIGSGVSWDHKRYVGSCQAI